MLEEKGALKPKDGWKAPKSLYVKNVSEFE
jgi:hypothetical protein